MLTHDAQRAFLIPADSRDKYFTIVDELSNAIGNKVLDAIDPHNDPIVIVDLEILSEKNWTVLKRKFEEAGCKEVTDVLIKPGE